VVSWHRSLMVSSTGADTNSVDAVPLDLVVSDAVLRDPA
jgi:hypothetical protein